MEEEEVLIQHEQKLPMPLYHVELDAVAAVEVAVAGKEIDRRLKIQLLNASKEFFVFENSLPVKKRIVVEEQVKKQRSSKREEEPQRRVNGGNEKEFEKGKGKKGFDEREKEERQGSSNSVVARSVASYLLSGLEVQKSRKGVVEDEGEERNHCLELLRRLNHEAEREMPCGRTAKWNEIVKEQRRDEIDEVQELELELELEDNLEELHILKLVDLRNSLSVAVAAVEEVEVLCSHTHW